MQLALVLDMFIKFYSLPRHIFKTKDILARDLKIPPPIMQYILDNFTSSLYVEGKQKLFRTQEQVLKSFYYSVVLAFVVNDFSFDAEILARSLKIDNKEIVNKLKILGCTFPGIKKEIVHGEDETGRTIKKEKKIKSLIVNLKAPLTLRNENITKK